MTLLVRTKNVRLPALDNEPQRSACDQPQLFNPGEVLAAAEREFGAAAAWMDIESVWMLLFPRSSGEGAK